MDRLHVVGGPKSCLFGCARSCLSQNGEPGGVRKTAVFTNPPGSADSLPRAPNGCPRPHDSTEQWLSRPCVILDAGPDGKAERDLVNEVSKVVHQVERVVIHAAQQVPEEVAERVDGPARGDDEAHGGERGLHVLAHLVAAGSHGTGFAQEDLVQDEPPSAQAEEEALPGVDDERENRLHFAADRFCMPQSGDGSHSSRLTQPR